MEFVYVVPRSRMFRSCYPQGLVPFGPAFSREAFFEAAREHGFFVEREYAERTPDLKQVIPYSVVTDSESRVLLMRRLKDGGENRLHDKLSIGVGGHLNPVDAKPLDPKEEASPARPPARSPRDPIAEGTHREVAEELHIRGTYHVRTLGIINDDSNAVGAVHVGIAQVLTVQGTVDIRERDVLEGRLVSPGELDSLRREGANFESWSALLVDKLDEILRPTAPAVLI